MTINQDPESQKATDELVTMHFAVGVLATMLGSAAVLWMTGIRWLVEHKVLVDASDEPLITIPRAAGAGLDINRVVIIAAFVIALVAIGLSAALRHLRYRRRYH